MAAVLACGQSAALSHGNAADLLGISREWPAGVVEGIRVTTPARTLIDLAGSLASPELERAVAPAMARWRTDREVVVAQADRYRRHRGVWRLRTLMADS